METKIALISTKKYSKNPSFKVRILYIDKLLCKVNGQIMHVFIQQCDKTKTIARGSGNDTCHARPKM